MSPVPSRLRFALSVVLGLALGWKAYTIAQRSTSDLAQVWYAARAVLAGHDPYPLIGPARAFDWGFPLFYPLPAAIVATPLAPLPLAWADALFVALGVGCFAWALMEYGYGPLLGVVSTPLLGAVESVQWSPLLAAAFVLAPIGILAVAKPTVGAALFVARPSWWIVIGGFALLAASFVIQPGWVAEWRAGFAGVSHFAIPLLQPGGFVALLALLRWRRPEARLILALACVPQTQMMYESVPLLLVPRTAPEAAIMLVLSWAQQALMARATHGSLYGGAAWLWMLYLAAAVMVLRRPNEGPVVSQWPAWLRPSPTHA